jgi:hypothetical protein
MSGLCDHRLLGCFQHYLEGDPPALHHVGFYADRVISPMILVMQRCIVIVTGGLQGETDGRELTGVHPIERR